MYGNFLQLLVGKNLVENIQHKTIIFSHKNNTCIYKAKAWILDPFTGSSTTGIAANLINRRFLELTKKLNFRIKQKTEN